MNNAILKDNNVVDLGSAKRAFMSNPVQASDKDSNIALVDNYLKQLDWQVNENSNMSYSIQGLNNYIASEISGIIPMIVVPEAIITGLNLDEEADNRASTGSTPVLI